jgi:gluconolactonase
MTIAPDRNVQPFAVYAPEFAALVQDASLELVAEVDAHEGPVYAPDEDALYFTTLPRRDAFGVPHVTIERLPLDGLRFPLAGPRRTTVRTNANVANGMFLARDGRLVVCEQGTFTERARISVVDRATGNAETVVDSCGGYPLSSPNDVVVHEDGSIWFTDPGYGYLQGFRPRPELSDALYRYDPQSNHVSVAATLFDKPNGLAFSPDGRTLYVGDNGRPHHLVAFDVGPEGRLHRRRILAPGTPGHPDGVKVDTRGRIYVSTRTGIQVLDPNGALLGEIYLPGAVNFTFGGPERNVLFITADSAIWAAVLNAKGATPWPSSERDGSSRTTERMQSWTPPSALPATVAAVSS